MQIQAEVKLGLTQVRLWGNKYVKHHGSHVYSLVVVVVCELYIFMLNVRPIVTPTSCAKTSYNKAWLADPPILSTLLCFGSCSYKSHLGQAQRRRENETKAREYITPE